MKKIIFGCQNPYGYYAYIECGVLVIGENWPREGGDLYSGDYLGDATPYLSTLKKEAPEIYNKIVKYFEAENENKKDIIYLSDLERLKKVFNDVNASPRNMNPELYFALLAVLYKEKHDEVLSYFKKYAREYLI